ncbi:hypothetical protein RI367_004304 [Sorochytrium milnesiophthora]
MSIAALAHRHVFGLKADVRSNIHYLDDTSVIYPAGNNTILYQTELKSQKFIPVQETCEGITAMALTPSRRHIAIAERSEVATVVIYDLLTLRKRKCLTLNAGDAKEFVSLSFSADSKYIITQGGAPDWMLYNWTWEKGKVIASVKVAAQRDCGVSQVSFNPWDSAQVAVSGPGVLKIYKYLDGALKTYMAAKSENKLYYSHTWLSETKLLVAMPDGHLVMYEGGEQKLDFVNTFGPLEQTRDVHIMMLYSRGFLAGGQNGTMTVYEKGDELTYKKIREYMIPDETSNITSLALSPSEETLLCSLSNSQVFTLSLTLGDIKTEESRFEHLSQSFHHGQITGLDTCIRKPLVVTCSTDHSVRVWNYVDCTGDLVKYFPEEAHSVSFHPSGLYILVGFSDKLRLMNLLIDDIRTFRDFAIRGCRECQFSNGGQYFAAVHGSIIQIYNTWTFENVGNLKGHNGKVRSLAWSQDDSKLVSAGMDGAIYEWNLKEMRREGENILKSCGYTCVVCTTDGKTLYAVGSDKMLKEISEAQIVREVECNTTLTQVELSQNNRMMFAATATGSVRALKFPFMLTDNGDFQEHEGHSSAVNRLRISYDDQYLFSCADDGSMIVWKVSDKERNALKKDREITYADEILITKTDLEDKMSTMAELKARVEELKMENEYQLRLKDMNFNEKIKEVTEKYQEEIEGLKITSTVLKTDKEKEEVRHEEEMSDERSRHMREMTELETSHNLKLMSEYEKYQELQVRMADLQQQWESELRELEHQKEVTLAEVTAQYEAKIAEKQHDIERMQEELRLQIKEFDETTRETEEDTDTEILDLKHRYERRLKEEREAGLRLKGENGIMKKKFHTLQNEIESHKSEIQKMFLEEKKLHSIIKSLEKDLAGVKKEILERDETIQDKEKRIYDLKKKNQELEKFKFVLDYKIKELKKQIEPREQDIVSMSEQIKDMDEELSNYSKVNRDLELAINDLKLKLKAAEQEVQRERARVKYLHALLKRFKTDLHECAQLVQDPKQLKASLKALYHKYCKDFTLNTEDDDNDSAVASSDLSETDAQREYARQRDYLERTMTSMRTTVSKDQTMHRTDNAKIMQENVALIREINQLRKDIKGLKLKDSTTAAVPDDAVNTPGTAARPPSSPSKLPAISAGLQ